jgi:hypothetical protein
MADIWSKTLWIYALAVVVAMVIAVVIKLIVLVLDRIERKTMPRPAPVPAAPAFDLAADHVVAIAAAVHALIGAHRVVRIEPSRRQAGWRAEGRHAHHASHGQEHHPKH